MMKTWFSCRRGILSLVLALCLMVSLVPRSYAAEVDTPTDKEVELYYTGTFLISASLSIEPSGEAECWGSVDCYRGYTADAVMRLQWKNSNGVWIDWNSWDAEGTVIDFYETDTVPLDRVYRVRVVAVIYDSEDNIVEVVDAVSGTEPFPNDSN